MNNYITERELKGYIPGLSKYLWAGENDFQKQKLQAEQIVISDLANKGYLIRLLQPRLYLSADGTEDTINALRFVCTSTGAGSVTLYGCSEVSGTYETIKTLNFANATTDSYLINNAYRYYKVDSDTFNPFLCEITYDRLFAYKWLELILLDAFKEQDDAYYLKMTHFKEEYRNTLNGLVINTDADEDGEPDTRINTNSINVMR